VADDEFGESSRDEVPDKFSDDFYLVHLFSAWLLDTSSFLKDFFLIFIQSALID